MTTPEIRDVITEPQAPPIWLPEPHLLVLGWMALRVNCVLFPSKQTAASGARCRRLELLVATFSSSTGQLTFWLATEHTCVVVSLDRSPFLTYIGYKRQSTEWFLFTS